MSRSRTIAFLCAVLLLPATGACANGAAALDSSERGSLDNWMFCTECDNGELDSVLALAARKPAATVDTLTRDLLTGVSGVRRDNILAQFAADYQAMVSTAVPTAVGPEPSQDAYVARYFANASALTRSRAAIALASVGASRARAALDAAADSVARGSPSFASTVADVVLFARDSLWHP